MFRKAKSSKEGRGAQPQLQERAGQFFGQSSKEGRGPTGPVAELIAARFKVAVKRYGLDGPRRELDVTQFRVPPDMRPQVDLFDLAS